MEAPGGKRKCAAEESESAAEPGGRTAGSAESGLREPRGSRRWWLRELTAKAGLGSRWRLGFCPARHVRLPAGSAAPGRTGRYLPGANRSPRGGRRRPACGGRRAGRRRERAERAGGWRQHLALGRRRRGGRATGRGAPRKRRAAGGAPGPRHLCAGHAAPTPAPEGGGGGRPARPGHHRPPSAAAAPAPTPPKLVTRPPASSPSEAPHPKPETAGLGGQVEKPPWRLK